MIIKRLVLIFAALVIVVGLSQLSAASWWVSVLPGFVNSKWLAVFGVASILYGALMLIAVAERLVILRGFFLALGLIGLATGGLAVINPAMTRDLVGALMLNRTGTYQVFLVWVGGLLRIIIGAVLIYAVMKARGGVVAGGGAGDFPEEPGG